MIQARLKQLREEMAKRNIAIYIVPTSDFHESEYVGVHFKAREFMTGFTGSAGTAVITMTEAGLWTDGRYFVQAEKQLEGSTVTLYKSGEEGVPTIEAFLEEKLNDGEILGFDGRVVNATWGKKLEDLVSKKSGSLSVEEDLVDIIWTNRPAMSKAPVMILDEKYAGQAALEKMKKVREVLEKENASVHLLSSLYDICWLLNVRGGDISYVPVVLSYLAISKDKCIWFLQLDVVTNELKAYLDSL